MLDIFWDSHNPAVTSFSRQYANIVFYSNDIQLNKISASLETIKAKYQRPLTTKVRQLDKFYPAEDYHQKYYLQGNRLLGNEIGAIYPDIDDLRDSTVAARLNGYIAGNGYREILLEELPLMGLSENADNYLKQLAARLPLLSESPIGFSGSCPVPATGIKSD